MKKIIFYMLLLLMLLGVTTTGAYAQKGKAIAKIGRILGGTEKTITGAFENAITGASKDAVIGSIRKGLVSESASITPIGYQESNALLRQKISEMRKEREKHRQTSNTFFNLWKQNKGAITEERVRNFQIAIKACYNVNIVVTGVLDEPTLAFLKEKKRQEEKLLRKYSNEPLYSFKELKPSYNKL